MALRGGDTNAVRLGRRSPLRILVLGGTRFLGPVTIEAALARGHVVTTFNRGRLEKRHTTGGRPLAVMDKVERLHGNRDPEKPADDADPQSPRGLAALEGREFDAVIDTSASYPTWVRASAALLAPSCGHYVVISSIARYADTVRRGGDETSPAATMANPRTEDMGEQFENYGPLKALCEDAAERTFPGRVTIVRPTYIVGPGDPMRLFTYWPVRIARAVGERREVLVPGTPDDAVQVIDVRDLAEWLIRIVESRTFGIFNACGPADRLSAGALLSACRTAAGTDPVFTYVPESFLERHDITLPILSARLGVSRIFHHWSNARAVAAGLTFRPIVQTCQDTLVWFNGLPEDRRHTLARGIPSPAREAKALEAWHEAEAGAVGARGRSRERIHREYTRGETHADH
jgi:2'-hydroxyisoflavone reductase